MRPPRTGTDHLYGLERMMLQQILNNGGEIQHWLITPSLGGVLVTDGKLIAVRHDGTGRFWTHDKVQFRLDRQPVDGYSIEHDVLGELGPGSLGGPRYCVNELTMDFGDRPVLVLGL